MSEFYEKYLQAITDEYTAGDFYREVYDAKKEFFEILGVINEDDSDFENQMDIFMGWYLFDRPLQNFDLAPVYLYYRQKHEQMKPEEEGMFKNLTEVKHSVYELIKHREGGVTLRDLSTKDKIDVMDSRYGIGFSIGDIFEARLIPHEGKFCFAAGFCLHPRGAFKFLEEQMKKVRQQEASQKNKLMMKLNQMKYKHGRFPHIDVKHIYTLTPKF